MWKMSLASTLLLLGAGAARADRTAESGQPAVALEAQAPSAMPDLDRLGAHEGRWAWGAQITSINQVNTKASGSPVNPALSFATEPSLGWSTTASIFGALSPWQNGLLVIMPEYANGRGLPNASGLAGYPNGDIVRVPALGKEPYLARLYYHHTIPLSSEQSDTLPDLEGRFMPAGVHGLGAGRAAERIELTVGKFAANDFFDASGTGSDPRHHFMSWALMENGAWDYAADTRGYTWGAVAAWETPRIAVRGGVLLMPTVANGPDFDWNVRHHRSEVVEGELRYSVFGHAGAAKLMAYLNHAHMGNYNEALARAPGPHDPDACPGGKGVPCIVETEKVGAIKYGAGLLIDQQFTDALSGFFRAGWSDGQTETFAFTEIDRSVSAGAELMGAAWGRSEDRLSLGIAASGLSRAHAAYLAAGGVGFQLGDGALRYAPELLVEAAYMVRVARYLDVTFDAMATKNPGMNADRGAVAIFGLRLHAHY